MNVFSELRNRNMVNTKVVKLVSSNSYKKDKIVTMSRSSCDTYHMQVQTNPILSNGVQVEEIQ
jgi:hypothetical protein